MFLFASIYHYVVLFVCVLFYVVCDIDYLNSVHRSPVASFTAENNIIRLNKQGEVSSGVKDGLFSQWAHLFQKEDEIREEEVDTTIYVHNVSEIDRLSHYHEGVILWNYHGGFANQMYSLISSIILAEVKKVPFFYVDSSIDQTFIIKRPSGLPVISLSENVLKVFAKGEKEVFRCFTQDIIFNPRGYMKFHSLVESIKQMSIIGTFPSSPFVVVDSNCPLFYYWSLRLENCIEMQKYHYLSSSTICERISSAQIPSIVKNFFKQHIVFRKPVIDRIEQILKPYKKSLIPAKSSSKYPFRKYKNLITIHARFGLGGADFKDYREFLSWNDSLAFHNCLQMIDAKNASFIYLATDSSKFKEEFARIYGKRLIMSTERAHHSARDLDKESDAGAVTTVTDFTILTMGSLFVGTSMSSYSSLSELQGGFDSLRVSQKAKTCSFGSLYLPI